MQSPTFSRDICLAKVWIAIFVITFCQLLIPGGQDTCSETQEKVVKNH